ncbi:MAG: hypothetical protein CVU15_07615 [Betaproteobacteria bacterium HGW-Betaproteobacteria-1]|jgi:hypothetical protein|nr:MAG: hypothetical protein CVU15_07615 [Betaproteobacteria bacterium HGW-Betaproteobacteria-1]
MFLLFALSGCNAVKVSYNNAQELTYWWLNSYVHFTAEQKPVIKAELAALHDWHRFNEIPVYIKLLETTQKKVLRDTSSKEVCSVVEDIRERMRILNLQTEPIVEKLAPSLSHEQLEHMQRHFDRNNAKWRKDWLDGSQKERDEHRLKLAIKRAEMFYGRINDAQRKILQENIHISTFNADTSHDERLRRQADAIATLKKIIDMELEEPDIKLEIAAYFDRLQNGDDLAYKNYMDRLTADSCDGFAKLHNSTSAKQRQYAADKLGGYIQDLEALKSSAQIQ